MERDRHQVWLNGRLVDARQPHLSLADRGFQLGDGVFETLRSRRGVPIELAEHLDRLRAGLHLLEISIPYADSAIGDAIDELLEAEGLANDAGGASDPGGASDSHADASIRVTVTRGATPGRGLLPPAHRSTPAVAIQAAPYTGPAPRLLEQGVAAVVSSIRRDLASPLAAVKSTSRATDVYARLEAERAGADDAICLTTDGRVAEATAANLAIVTPNRVTTPPLTAGILAGTTRRWLLAQREILGLAIVEGDVALDDLLASDEAFLTSSLAGIVPLTSVDGRPIGTGKPGRVATALRQLREGWIESISRSGRAGMRASRGNR